MTHHSPLITHHWLVIALLLVAGSAPAQDDHQSHIPVPLPSNVDPARMFRDRLQQARLAGDLADIVKQFGSKDAMPNQDQILKILQANPQLLDMFKNRDDPKVRDLVGKALQANKLPGLRAEDIQRKLENLTPPEPIESRSSPPRLAPPPRPSERPTVDPAEETRKLELANQLGQWAKKLRLPESLRNSPAAKDLFQRLSDSAAESLNGAGGTAGWESQIASMEARWDKVRDWLPKELPASLQKLKIPDLSRLAPNVHLPEIELDPPQAPSFRQIGFGRVEFSSLANVLLGALGLAVMAILIWQLSRGRMAASFGSRRTLGPWPLDPGQVASRGELIQAFEYLSLLRCGESVRTWNHRAIALCLGGAGADSRAAAESLAELYEQARYAPVVGGEPDWAAARGPLTLLAGAG